MALQNLRYFGNSLAVQWSGLGTFTAEGLGSIPGQGTKIPQAKTKTKSKTNQQQQKNLKYFVHC